MNKMEDKPQKIRIPHIREWMATFVYMCPWHEGGVGGANEHCTQGGKPYTNCTGMGTFSCGGCTQVKEYFDTFAKFVKKELNIH